MLRTIAVVAALTFIDGACDPSETQLWVDSTAPTRHVLDSDALHRLRECESTHDYTVTSPSGTYRGAYQFDQPTWNGVADRHFPWLHGLDPATVDPWWQDAMARALYSERGAQPWPICGRNI